MGKRFGAVSEGVYPDWESGKKDRGCIRNHDKDIFANYTGVMTVFGGGCLV